MILKQKFSNHIFVLGFTLITTLIFFLLWLFFKFDKGFLIVVGSYHVIFTIPALFIHIQYTIANMKVQVELINNELSVTKKGFFRKYKSSDLKKIIIYKPASLDRSGIPFLAIEYYRYVRILAKNGDEIIITCLMILDIDSITRNLPDVQCERKKRIAFLNWK